MKLAYRIWNSSHFDIKNAQVPKLLLLHGMGGTGALWRPLAAGLEDRYAVLAPDQRGHGESQIPHVTGSRIETRYTPLDYGQDLVETLDELEVKSCWVVGHSMGVRSACALAHLKPELVRGLILIDLGFSGVAGGGLGEGLSTFLKNFPMRFSSRAEARLFMDQNCPDPSMAQYLMAVAVPISETEGGGLTFPFDKAALISTIHAARDISVRKWVEEAAQNRIRVLALRGARSLVWSREEFERERAHFAGSPTIEFEEVPGAGHGLPFEKRAELTAKINNFLA